jgi:gliding motility-associated-like protein
MKFFLALITLLLSQFMSLGQIMLERQVISCFGWHSSTSDTTICSTAGQVEINTLITNNGIITQGFHQPRGPELLFVDYTITKNSCTDLYTVHITNISGCGNESNSQIFWNGIEGDTLQENLPALTTLEIISVNGCNRQIEFDFSTMEVNVLPCELIMYNTITPNNDGSNDQWEIGNIDNEYFNSNSVKIYNRWGIKVWECDHYDNNANVWTGTTKKGELLPSGTYFYEFELNGNIQTGFIELIR